MHKKPTSPIFFVPDILKQLPGILFLQGFYRENFLLQRENLKGKIM